MARLKSDITRRDFMNGVALSVAAGALSPAALVSARAQDAGPYPPSLSGLRGVHVGAFEAAHAIAWEGRTWQRPIALTDSIYDLVVVGAGLSGLAAAHQFRELAGKSSRVLIIDNHDDFGGHAKRNEFTVDGTQLIGYGGSQSIDGPGHFSKGAKHILKSLGVKTKKFYDYFDQDYYERRGMRQGLHLDKANFGADTLTDMPFGYWSEQPDAAQFERTLALLPIDDASKVSLRDLVLGSSDYFAGKSIGEKIAFLRSISFEDYLRKHAGASETVILILRKSIIGLWGAGWDVLSALEAARWGMAGTLGLGLSEALANSHDFEEPYIFHFPDGNASLARLLVRNLIPGAVGGDTMEDIVLARVDYSALDHDQSPTRIRLNSTAVDIRHTVDRNAVDVVYVRAGVAQRVCARHVIMAGYMAMAPYIIAEMEEAQKEAIRFFTKIPLVYVNIALRNWRAFDRAGYHRIYAPCAFYESMALDFPVSIGDYRFSSSPDEPIILHMQQIPIAPGKGLNEKDQHRAGRQSLYALSYDDYEIAIVNQLTAALGSYGFDAERDIAGITVNRWPHGYAYEYNELFDPPEWTPENGPHIAARKQIGRISIANSDSSAYAYVNGAFDAAIRAVDEQLTG